MKSLFRGVGLVAVVVAMCSGAAQGSPDYLRCTGYCTVTCESGAEHHYYTYDYQCCGKINVCPDGGTAVWWPDTPYCDALIC